MIDPNKTYRTRDGRAVRIYAVDGVGKYPVHGAFEVGSGWYPCSWKEDGTRRPRDIYNLVEANPYDQLLGEQVGDVANETGGEPKTYGEPKALVSEKRLEEMERALEESHSFLLILGAGLFSDMSTAQGQSRAMRNKIERALGYTP